MSNAPIPEPTRGPSFRAIRAALTVLATILLVAPLAAAATRYVNPAGNDSNDGSSPARAWATIGKANASLQPGDACIISPGVYSHRIDPVNSGTGPQARITYVGDLSNPARVVVDEIVISKAWVTVKGVKANRGALFTFPARHDSVAYCELSGIDFWAAKHCMAARNVIAGSVGFYANDGRACFGGTTLDPGCRANSEYDTLRGNSIDFGVIKTGEKRFVMRGFTQQCLVDSNRIAGVFDRAGTSLLEETFGLILYNSYDNTFRDNRWTFEATSAAPPNNQWEAFRLRDSTHNILFERDTMLCGVNSQYPVRGLFAASGSFVHTTRQNRWNRCYYKSNSYFYTQDAFDRCTIESSVFASRDENALDFEGLFENSVLRHNTIYSGRQAIHFRRISGSGCEITSNIFYSAHAGPPGNEGGQAFFETQATQGFVSNHNLFFTPSYSSAPGDRSIVWCCYGSSRPGAGTPWHALNRQDGNSRYGSPLFVDSTFAGLDARLRPGSAAIGAGAGGTDAGAHPFRSEEPDVTPPAAVTDLSARQVTDRTVDLLWTAPGDDGRTGTAAQYDLRWSTQPISDANFGNATPMEIQPVPQPAGTAQGYLVMNLQASTGYHFALKSRDEAGNVSGLSNVLSVTTLPDQTPPAPIQDLRTSP